MSTKQSFSSQQDPFFPDGPASPTPTQRTRWPFILAVMLGFGLLFCGGIVMLGYIAIQKAAGVRPVVDLPDQMPSRSDDRDQFNASLTDFVTNPTADPCVAPEVCEFVETSIGQLRNNETIPFSREMFLGVVAASPIGEGKIGLAERLTINTWLTEYEPIPTIEQPNHRILNIHLNGTGDLATVDMLIYSSDSQAQSVQWYLVQENDAWKMYDWQRLEYGRRMSDEYAGYAAADTPNAEGYDRTMQQLAEAKNLWLNGERTLAEAKLRKCESTPMLAADRPVALLRTAYTWMGVGEDEEAIRILKNIPNPDQSWGVWPSMAACFLNTGQQEEGLQAALKAQTQSPDHPNVQWLLSQLKTESTESNESTESADRLATALQFCPHDATYLAAVVANNRPEDIPLIIDCILLSDNSSEWSQLLDSAARSTAWGKELLTISQKRADLPPSFGSLVKANIAWSKADYDDAAELFLKARDEAKAAMLRDIAIQDHFSARLENGRIAELFREVTPLEDVLAQLTQQALDENLDIAPEEILAALEQVDTENSNWASGLRGHANYQLRRYELALPDLDRFSRWITTQSETSEDDEDPSSWIVEAAASQLTEVLIELDQPMDVLKRWPSDLNRHHHWGTLLLQRNNDDKRRNVLAAFEDTLPDSIDVQRSRFLALDARLRGDANTCDQHHRDALEKWKTLNSDEFAFRVQALISDRARDAVWNRFTGPPLDQQATAEQPPLSESFFMAAAREANALKDEQTIRHWIDYAAKQGIKTGDTNAVMQNHSGDLLLETGNYEEAAKAYLAAIEQEQDKDTWRSDQRRLNYIDSMIKAEKMDELLAWLSTQGESTAWDRATVELATGNGENLIDLLADQPKEEVTRWLQRAQQRRSLERYTNEAWIDTLLNEYPIYLSYLFGQASGDLVMLQKQLPATEQMQRWVQQAVGSDTEPIKISLRDDQQHAWVANLENGQRYLVAFELMQYESSSLPESIRLQLADSVLRISLHVIDHQPQATRRLFAAVARIANEDAVAFQWNDRGLLWAGEKLADQLKWQNRVPVQPSLGEYRLLSDSDFSESNEVDLSLTQWADALQATSDKTLPIVTRQSLGSITEKRPAQLTNVNLDEYFVQVQMEADSQLDPLAKSGRQFRCNAGNVQER
ncbi:MAG: hypothetical protein P8L85_15160 [Rubripirellula sp.]|nr:hypothetical protein [Rubripirellula sp.]